jgi:hypothetical protein
VDPQNAVAHTVHIKSTDLVHNPVPPFRAGTEVIQVRNRFPVEREP